MPTHNTKLGKVVVDSQEGLFRRLVSLAEDAWSGHAPFSWALSGGSTPKAFYQWAVAARALAPDLVAQVDWTVSDERCKPLSDADSNFGNAERLLLEPLGAPRERRYPWPATLPPHEAAARYEAAWRQRPTARPDECYDLCLVGMGDDAHTLSLFPGSELLRQEPKTWFAAVEVPGKGWRLTLTPAGLAACRHIVVLAVGPSKAEAFRRGLYDPDDPAQAPVQLLARWRERVTWLMDAAAAAALH